MKLKRIVVAFSYLPVTVLATPPVPAPAPDGGLGAILQKQIENQLPAPNPLPIPGPKEEKPKAEEKQVGPEATVTVKSFKVEGVTALPMEQIQAVLAHWINQTVTLSQLQEAADAVSKLYSDKGFLAEVVVPPQKIVPEEGVVILKVTEVRLGGVKVNSKDPEPPLDEERIASYITNASPVGEVINTDNIQRGVLLLREVPGMAVTTAMGAGTKEGEATLNVAANSTSLVTGNAGYSNYGSASTGQNQATVGVNLNNLMGFGDALRFNASQTDGSTFGQVALSIPVTTTGWVASLTANGMHYRTIGAFKGSKGASHSYSANLAYALLRSQAANLNFTTAYDMKFYRNFTAAGSVVSDYNVHAISATLSGNAFDGFWGGGMTSGSLSFLHGHWTSNNWDPTLTSNYGEYNPPGYGKTTYSLARNQNLLGDKTTLNLSVMGQFAFNNLDGGEKFYLGGPNAVRAYPTSQAGGDSGSVLTLELQHLFYEGLQGLVFFDGGYVRQYKNANTYSTMVTPNTTNADNIYYLSGAGVGSKYTWRGLSLAASIAWPIGINPLYVYSAGAQRYLKANADDTSGHPYAWLQASYTF